MAFIEITDRKHLLTKYGSDFSKLKEMIEALPQGATDFVPDIKDAWSIREHIAHLMDIEIRNFIRYRNAIASPGINLILSGGDVKVSNTLFKYSSQDVNDALEIMRLLRSIVLKHISTMSDDEMMTYGIQHPDLGKINLRMILSMTTQHVDKHIEYLNRNTNLFKERQDSSTNKKG